MLIFFNYFVMSRLYNRIEKNISESISILHEIKGDILLIQYLIKIVDIHFWFNFTIFRQILRNFIIFPVFKVKISISAIKHATLYKILRCTIQIALTNLSIDFIFTTKFSNFFIGECSWFRSVAKKRCMNCLFITLSVLPRNFPYQLYYQVF